MSRKILLNEAENFLNNLGYEILNKDEYKDSCSKLILIDKNGYKYYQALYQIKAKKNKNNLAIFHDDNPYSLENISIYIKNNNIGVKILNDKYLGVKSEYSFICKCGNKFNRTLDSFINAKSWYCRNCALSIGQDKTRNKLEDIQKAFIERKFVPLFTEYKNVTTPLLCKNPDGYIGKISYSNFKKGKSFISFKVNSEFLIDNLKLLCNKKGVEFVGIKKLGKTDKDTIINIICPICNNKFSIRRAYLDNNEVIRCSKCSGKKSSLEIKTERWLIKNNIKFENQKVFEECKYKTPLFFDFYLPDYNIAIECDGKQHEEPSKYFGGEENFKQQKIRDEIKNNYCKEKNIKLKRIFYKDFKNTNYKNILNNIFTLRSSDS